MQGGYDSRGELRLGMADGQPHREFPWRLRSLGRFPPLRRLHQTPAINALRPLTCARLEAQSD